MDGLSSKFSDHFPHLRPIGPCTFSFVLSGENDPSEPCVMLAARISGLPRELAKLASAQSMLGEGEGVTGVTSTSKYLGSCSFPAISWLCNLGQVTYPSETYLFIYKVKHLLPGVVLSFV